MSTQSSFGKEAILFTISSVLLPHLHSDLYLFVVIWVAVHRIYILYIPTTHTICHGLRIHRVREHVLNVD